MQDICYQNGDISWSFIPFTQVSDDTGKLSVVEYGKEVSFVIKRVFFLSEIVNGCERGFHSHQELKQYLVCAAGSFTIRLDNGHVKSEIQMTSQSPGLFLDGKVWREMADFSNDCVVMVLCDREYRFDKVIRDYDKFQSNLKE